MPRIPTVKVPVNQLNVTDIVETLKGKMAFPISPAKLYIPSAVLLFLEKPLDTKVEARGC